MSKGERAVAAELERLGVKYIEQHVFDDCRGKRRRLPFDFYLPELGIAIEYQGSQHRKAVFSKKAFKNQIINDQIKKEYCRDSGIRLVEINSLKEVKLLERLIEKSNPNLTEAFRYFELFVFERFQDTK